MIDDRWLLLFLLLMQIFFRINNHMSRIYKFRSRVPFISTIKLNSTCKAYKTDFIADNRLFVWSDRFVELQQVVLPVLCESERAFDCARQRE